MLEQQQQQQHGRPLLVCMSAILCDAWSASRLPCVLCCYRAVRAGDAVCGFGDKVDEMAETKDCLIVLARGLQMVVHTSGQ